MKNFKKGTLALTIICAVLINFSFVKDGGPLFSHKDKKFTWYGVDFRKAKFIGSSGFSNPDEISKVYLTKWNNIILDESSKYDLKGALKVKNYSYKIDWMIGMNDEVDVGSNIQGDSYSISEADVKKHIKGYHGADGDGIGIVFIVESFNKFDEKGYFWVTFFDEKSKEVILTEHINGNAGGFGLRNYWSSSMNDVIEQIESKKQKKWFSKK
ncbi:MAG: hypothetical protein ACI9J3_002601 [Parvicellaceae bacterium]|jgi:hypothetical protein